MKATEQLQLAGIHVFTDRVDIDHLRYGKGFRGRVRRFSRLQTAAIAAGHQGAWVRAARLVCLDMVRPNDLHLAIASTPYGYRGQPCIEWHNQDTKDLERRLLSSLTSLAWNESNSSDSEINGLVQFVRTLPGFETTDVSAVLAELALDQICWASQHLPKPLWAHVAGLRRFTTLARGVLGNEHPSLVPRLALDEERCRRSAEASAMLDSAVLAGRKLEQMPAAVELASKVFGLKSKEDETETLTRWGKGLISLRAHVERGDIASGVIVAWNYDLVENGTVSGPNARLETRARYARIANTRLWRMLASMPPDIARWSRQELGAGYLAMMADASCSDLQGLGAAISSFQVFLQETFGIPTSQLGLHKLIPEPQPRAQWICQTAIGRAVRWLDQDEKGDPRLKAIAALILSLAKAGPFRLNELRWLRLQNVHLNKDGTAEIEITAMPGSSELKTDAAKRRIPISDPDVVHRLKRWLDLRQAEGCPITGLVFGEVANDGRTYRSHAVHTTLLALLRQSTGDPNVTFHALRHTFISDAVEVILLTSNAGMNNRLSQIAAWAGHEVAVTTIKFYSHRYEIPMRSRLDSVLHCSKLTNSDGARLLGIKANTLTQSCRRGGFDLSTYIWSCIQQVCDSWANALPSINEGYDRCEPTPLRLTGPISRKFTVGDCLRVLEELANGIDATLLEHRYGINPSARSSIETAAVGVASEVYATRGRLCPRVVKDSRTATEHFELDFGRTRRQVRYAGFIEALHLPQRDSLLTAAAKAWTSSWWRGELSAVPPTSILPILQLLQACGVSAQALQLQVEAAGDESKDAARIELEMAKVAAAVFNDRIAVRRLDSSRDGRAAAYLLWPSALDVGSAGKSNTGFDCLMFALAVWARPEVQDWV